jgi:hypothetical protein
MPSDISRGRRRGPEMKKPRRKAGAVQYRSVQCDTHPIRTSLFLPQVRRHECDLSHRLLKRKWPRKRPVRGATASSSVTPSANERRAHGACHHPDEAIGARRFSRGVAAAHHAPPSSGARLPRKQEPTAPISGKKPAGQTGTIIMLSSPSEHGPGFLPRAHTRGRDQLHPVSVAAFARIGAALYSPQALTNDGNINAAFLCVGDYVTNAQHRAFPP